MFDMLLHTTDRVQSSVLIQALYRESIRLLQNELRDKHADTKYDMRNYKESYKRPFCKVVSYQGSKGWKIENGQNPSDKATNIVNLRARICII